MFDDDERFTLLMLLWNYKIEAEALYPGDDAPVEKAQVMSQLARNDVIVRKLGGDPTRPAFGLGPG